MAETDVILGISTDGVLAFKNNMKYSVYPVAATIYNFSPDIRCARVRGVGCRV